MALFLKRDTKVFLKKTVGAVSQFWEIPVLDGFSFSQGNTTSEVTLNEMASSSGASKRGRRAFNDALAPAEWSFSTYVRPFISGTAVGAGGGAGGGSNHHAIEEMLWANFVGNGGWTTTNSGIATVGNLTVAGATGFPVTYEIDDTEYTTGTGSGATFRVTVTAADAATITVINPGTGFTTFSTSATNGLITIKPGVIAGATTFTFQVTALTSTTTNYAPADIDNFVRTGSNLGISFAGSGVSELGTFDLFFVMGATGLTPPYVPSATVEIFKLTGCVVNEATVNFEVEGIAMIEWSGNAATLTMDNDTLALGNVITEGVAATSNFIRNKLTALSLVSNNVGTMRAAFPGAATNGVYNITLTGGSVTFSNNITFLTPETLGIVNIPIGHITGNKSVSGNFTAYLDVGTNGDSGSLFEHATSSAARSIVTNSFATTFRIGGTGGLPRMEITLPTAHLAIPTIQSEDVIAVDVAFEGLSNTISSNDEATITYVGKAL
jgi:hypothetical protein